jgi:hypothetical protein
MTNTETFTLVSSTPHWNGRTAVVFTVGAAGVIVQYYPNGTSGIPDGFCEVSLEGEPTIARIYQDDCLSRERAKKVWNRFRELNFTRI